MKKEFLELCQESGIEVINDRVSISDLLVLASGPYTQRVKKHLGKGFDSWKSKYDDEKLEKIAYQYVQRHLMEHADYNRKSAEKLAIANDIKHIEEMLKTADDEDKPEWSSYLSKKKDQLESIKLDERYANPI